MKNLLNPVLLFTMVVTKASKTCNWCGEALQTCAGCNGNGTVNDVACLPCNGNGQICPAHQGNWAG